VDHWQPNNEQVRRLHTEERLKTYRSDGAAVIGIGGAVAFWVSWSMVPLWVNILFGVVALAGLGLAAVSRPPTKRQTTESSGNERDVA
jgi:hypothetical protein